jgi:hypothetical protein
MKLVLSEDWGAGLAFPGLIRPAYKTWGAQMRQRTSALSVSHKSGGGFSLSELRARLAIYLC